MTPVTRVLRARNLMAMAFFELARPMAELLDPGMLTWVFAIAGGDGEVKNHANLKI